MNQHVLNAYQSPDDEISFHTLAEKSLNGILIVSRGGIHYINAAFTRITGYSRSDTLEMSPWDMVHPDERSKIRAMGLDRLEHKDASSFYETQWIHKNGSKIWVEVGAVLLKNTNPPKILANIIDISARKKTMETLKRKEEFLKIQSRRLEEMNTALKVILRQRNEETETLQRNIQFNVEKLVMPYLDELIALRTKPKVRAGLQAIRETLLQITAPHIRTFSSQNRNLSPKQLQVVNLVRQGKTSKQIAEMMGVSKATIDFHRNSIRKKLQLRKKKVNLRTYLDTSDPDPQSS